MRTRGRKRTRESSISQANPAMESSHTAQSDDENDGGQQNAPRSPKNPSRNARKRSRPSPKESTPPVSNRSLSPATALSTQSQPPAAAAAAAAANEDDDEDAAASIPVESSRRTTRSQNKFRRPALDVGLDWRAAKREREAAEAAKAEKQLQDARKKAEKETRAHHRRLGIQHIAALENEREQRDREEDEHLAAGGTARGYPASRKAGDTRQLSAGVVDGDDASGSEFTGEEESSERSGDEDDDEDVREPVAIRKKKTKAELKQQRRVKVRGEISTAKDVTPNAKMSRHAPEKRPSGATGAAALGQGSTSQKSPSLAPRKILTGDSDDAFRPGYKAKLVSQASRPRSSATPVSSSHHGTPAKTSMSRKATPGSSTPKHSASRIRMAGTPAAAPQQPPRGLPSDQEDAEDENETGGLDDDDVAINRDAVVRGSIGRSFQTLKVTYVEPQPQPKLKPKRTRRADMDPDKSLSAKLLDDWVRPTFDNILMPTLLDHYGSEDDFWTLEDKTATKRRPSPQNVSADNTEKRYLIDVLQEIIDSLYPREFRKLEQSDLLYRVARQRILNWRRGFYERATKIVKAGYEEYKSKNPDATTADLKKWAIDAVDPDKGHAFWEFPPMQENASAHGNLQSIFVLATFAPHIHLTANSHYEERRPPIGALSLALAAVDFAFLAYESGKYVTPTKKFDQQGVGHVSDWYLKDAVRPAVKKGDRWSAFIKRATEFSIEEASSTSVESAEPRRRRRPRRVLDSSPTRPDSE